MNLGAVYYTIFEILYSPIFLLSSFIVLLLMRSLLFRHKITAPCARDRRVRRGEIRKDKIKYNPFLCVFSELCFEKFPFHGLG